MAFKRMTNHSSERLDRHCSPIDWEAVYREQTPRLYNYFRYRTGDGETAQDLTAQTMLRAWRYRHRYQDDLGAFAAWLFQIARNIAVDYMRQANHWLPLSEAYDVPDSSSVEGEVQQRQDAARLYTLLRQLSARDQEIIALKYGASMTNRQIAEVTHLSESNVGTTLHRLVRRLRAQWDIPLPVHDPEE